MSKTKIFLHLPKCGGTTIAANLENHLGDRFFHYISKVHDDILMRHIETGFRDIAVMMVSNPKFPHAKISPELEVEYLAICREPVSAAVSLYNFTTNARHTRNYKMVRGLSFWEFYAYAHRIDMWRPNFQTYYMCNGWNLAALDSFLERHSVQLFTMADMKDVYRRLSGRKIDPALDRNRSPNFHKIDNALTSPTFSVDDTSKMISTKDLSKKDLRILSALFEVDFELWRRATRKDSGIEKRRNFTDQHKAKVALEAFRGDRTVQEIATEHQLRPHQVSTWQRQAIDGMAEHNDGLQSRYRAVGRHLAAALPRPQDRHARDVPVFIALAAAFRTIKGFRKADSFYRIALKLVPDCRPALLGRVDIALASGGGNARQALRRTDAALAVLPGDPLLLERRAAGLLGSGRAAEAAEQLNTLRAADMPDPVRLNLLLARAYRADTNWAAAIAIYEEILKQAPSNPDALLGRIDMALETGDSETALELSRRAYEQAPEDRPSVVRRQKALQMTGRSDEGIGLLLALIEKAPDYRLRMALAHAYIGAGDPDAADAVYARIIKADPDRRAHRAAILARTKLFENRGALTAAMTALEQYFAGWPAKMKPGKRRGGTAAGRGDDRIGLLPKYLELCLKSKDSERFLQTVPESDRVLEDFDEPALVRVAKLAKMHEGPRFMSSAVRLLLGRSGLAWSTVVFVMRIACALEDDRMLKGLERYFRGRVVPEQRRIFRIEAAVLRLGPLGALARARALPPAPRNMAEAAQIARLLLAAGKVPLANRYLRRCHRRWKGSPLFRDMLFTSYLLSGRPDGAARFLDRISQDQPGTAVAHLRISLLIATNRLPAAHTELKKQKSAGAIKPKARQQLQICLSLGLLDEAETLLPDIKAELASGPRGGSKTATHFRVSQFGGMLNELRLYKKFAAAEPGQTAVFKQAFFYPAKEAVEAWVARQPGGLPRAALLIPRSIFQYWDTPDIPAAVSQVMESWQRCPGYNYIRMDHKEALIFLRDRLGPQYARAFSLANHAAEECDFLRLCWLWAEGGIYVDSDDMRIGDLGGLLARGGGAIMFMEPYGSIDNNLLCARPGHPLLRIAMDMACQSLLARENDSTWAKTGPGLITRATAVYLEQVPQKKALQDLSILPGWAQRPYVRSHLRLPYKSTLKHWTVVEEPVPDPVVRLLVEASDSVAERDGGRG